MKLPCPSAGFPSQRVRQRDDSRPEGRPAASGDRRWQSAERAVLFSLGLREAMLLRDADLGWLEAQLVSP